MHWNFILKHSYLRHDDTLPDKQSLYKQKGPFDAETETLATIAEAYYLGSTCISPTSLSYVQDSPSPIPKYLNLDFSPVQALLSGEVQDI